MIQTEATSRPHKLRSSKGTLLGTITFPSIWEGHLRERGRLELYKLPPITSVYATNSTPLMDCRGTLIRSPRRDRYDDTDLELFGLTIEEFEEFPGCSFSPSMAYIRSALSAG